jgi:GH25 family lysozyme M1 (1,4-beta-N-acetylmuramidase)
MLKGIDVSSWNGNPFNPNTELAYKSSDFLIAKTTQGTGYVNPHAEYAIGRARADRKLFGFYHYAGGGDPRAEADYFVKQSKGYFGQGIPVLDWEGEQNAAWGSTTWCRAFVDRVHELTGVWCMIYTGLDGCRHAANCAGDCALWFAGYPINADSWTVPSFIYTIPAPWRGWTIWQFTSGGGVDRNVAELDAAGWLRIAGAEEQGKAKAVQLYQANGTDAQKWHPEWNKDGTVTLVSKSCGLALDCEGGKTSNGTLLQAYPKNGTDAQKFDVVQVKGGYVPKEAAPFELVPKTANGQRVDCRNGGTSDGTRIQLYKSNNTNAQRWAIIDDGSGYWTLVNVKSGKALDVKGGGR